MGSLRASSVTRFGRSTLGRSPKLIGQLIQLNGRPYEVLGVLPAKFSLRVLDFPFEMDVWTLITNDDPYHAATSPAPVSVIERLKPRVTMAQAGGELSRIQRELNRKFPDEVPDSGVLVAGLQQDNTRTIRNSLLLLLGAVAVLLLIACTNAASLVLGRDSLRGGEFAVRVALGCGVRRLLQQLTTETLLLFVWGIGHDFAIPAFTCVCFFPLFAGPRRTDEGVLSRTIPRNDTNRSVLNSRESQGQAVLESRPHPVE
jgi:hypothetical protein